MSILAIITARGGSQRLPGKNILDFAGRPLIAHTIQATLDARKDGADIARLIVTTDSEDIARIARQWGAETPFLRPARLAGSNATSLDTLRHAANWCAREDGQIYDWILLLQPTSPLRTGTDICAAIKMAQETSATAIISTCQITEKDLARMKYLAQDSLLPIPCFHNIQEEDQIFYEVNGAIYLVRWEVVMQENSLYGNRARPLVMPREKAIDIDTEADFIMAEALYRHSQMTQNGQTK